MPDLSVLIPSRNELFLANTIVDVLAHSEADTEIIVVLDGSPALTPLPDDPRVRVVELQESIGQRAATNLACRMSEAKYVLKLDAHCSVGQGFDRIMLEDTQPGWVMVPTMFNLHAFNWLCPNGHRRYQGPSGPCEQCGEPTEREMVWKAKKNPETTAMLFNRDLKFGYWPQYKAKQQGDLVETMSCLGACWMVSRDDYWKWDICDERHTSWGQMGTEVACKAWLSGGKLICTRKTSFSHMFRTQGKDFSFPYTLSNADVEKAREHSRWLWLGNNWPGAVRPLSWLIDHFAPIPGWEPTKSILYYSDNRLDPQIMSACQRQLEKSGLPIVSVTLKPMLFGDNNIVITAERGPLTMHRQILAGLEAMTCDVVFMAEHDVLYDPSHFEHVPSSRDVFSYDTNLWKVRYEDGHAVWTDDLQQLSGLCAYRELLLDFYRQRIAEIERNGFDRHYEPGPKLGDWKTENYQSQRPNLDIRHNQTLTRSKWRVEDFRNPRYARGWTEADSVAGWYEPGKFSEVLHGI